jgi:TolB-like protein
MKKILIAFLILLPFLPLHGNETTNQSTLAVLDFINISKNKGYDFLEKTIAESVMTSLQKCGKFNLVERQRLSDLIEEKKLVLSGLVEEDVSKGKKIGVLLKADNLVMGSFSSIDDRIEINARLVRSDTGEVLLAEKITEKMGNQLFAKINELSDAIIIKLLNQKFGFLDCDSTPQGSEVKIDGVQIGVTPITGKKMKAGRYSVSIVKEGYEVKDVSFEIAENQKSSYNFYLEQKNQIFYNSRISFFSHMFELFSPDYQIDWGFSFEYYWDFGLSFGGEIGGYIYTHGYKDTSAPGKAFEENSLLYYHRLNFLLKYHFFGTSRILSPYLGVGVGVLPFLDFSSTFFYYKAIVGLTLFPSSSFSYFLEAVYQNPGEITLQEKKFDFFGDYTTTDKKLTLQNVMIGIGIRIGF